MTNHENELICLLKAGDEGAIKLLFDKYYEPLCLFAEGIIKNHQSAEDIVEDLFVSIWLNAKNLTFYSSLRNYLFKSTYNNCLKYLNKLQKDKDIYEQLHYTLKDHEIIHSYTSDHPMINLLLHELESKISKIIESLPDQCKNIYKLNRFENLSYPEIAAKLNITVGTVKKQMSRAFQRFREELKDFILLIIIILFIK
jgi:RNA polymerase sigma-70 factor (ECF subfamily)